MYDKTKGVWRTINGTKVFIVNGLSVEESIKLREIEDAKNESLTELEEKLAHSIDEASDKSPITPITEEAIQKVGVISIPGYTENECAFIAEQHKELLRFARDKNGNIEILVKSNIYVSQSAKNYLRRAYKRIVKNDTKQEISKALQYFFGT